jgi:hypothetical protein
MKTAEISLVNAVDKFAEYSQIHAAYKAIEADYDELKQVFRNSACGRTMIFTGRAGVAVQVKQMADTICRVVEPLDLPLVIKWSGEHVFDLFTLHPSKGDEGSFDLNALRLRPKRDAGALIGRLQRPATARVGLLPQ